MRAAGGRSPASHEGLIRLITSGCCHVGKTPQRYPFQIRGMFGAKVYFELIYRNTSSRNRLSAGPADTRRIIIITSLDAIATAEPPGTDSAVAAAAMKRHRYNHNMSCHDLRAQSQHCACLENVCVCVHGHAWWVQCAVTDSAVGGRPAHRTGTGHIIIITCRDNISGHSLSIVRVLKMCACVWVRCHVVLANERKYHLH